MDPSNSYCAVVNTHQSYHDVLNIFLKSYFYFLKEIPLFVFTSKSDKNFKEKGFEIFQYSDGTFRDQYLECLDKVPFEYVLTFNDDYFLNGYPDLKEMNRCFEVLSNQSYSQIRFVRGPNFGNPTEFPKLYELDLSQPYFFSQTLALWKKEDLIRVYEKTPPSGIARKRKELQAEVLSNQACIELGLKGLIYFDDEEKVGSAHYECKIIPHIVSAVVDGFWNIKEYETELNDLSNLLSFELSIERLDATNKPQRWWWPL